MQLPINSGVYSVKNGGSLLFNLNLRIDISQLILMTSREEDQEVVYEEQEVLWAKIRGYPWWPAFVDKVHPISKGEEEAQYTVFFFGDNTQYFSSKLGASKLRKFYDYYTEFYQKARSHRKLMLSIQQAEKKLQQNDQNIQIFEDLRKSIKCKKTKGNTLNKNELRMSQRDQSSKKEELPQLNKSKTYGHNRQKIDNYEQPEQWSSKKEVEIQSTLKKDNSGNKTQKMASPSQKSDKKQQLPARPRRGLRYKKQQIFQEQESEQVQLNNSIAQQPKQQSLQKIEPEPHPPHQSFSPQQISLEEEKSQEDNIYTRKTRNAAPLRRANDKLSDAPRKRGRPKKQKNDSRLAEKMLDQQQPVVSKTKLKHESHQIKTKAIRKQIMSGHRRIDDMPIRLSQADEQIIQAVKDIGDNRDELINYLNSIDITVSNVKQILDLDVSNILQEGIITEKVSDLLELMKSVLLYKYFPEDIKHKKKYDKLMKKKLVIRRQRVSRDSAEASDRKQRREESSESKPKQQQIRKKTLAKLQKFLKNYNENQSKNKEAAAKIESFFERADSSIGQIYKSMAYKVLKSLKKEQTFSEVMSNLEHHRYN